MVIARLADASLRIKALAATAVSVLVGLVAAQAGRDDLLLVALVLLVALGLLDGYYLAVERKLRGVSADLVRQALAGRADAAELFTIATPEIAAKDLASAVLSPASLFYLAVGGLLVVGWAA